MITFVIPVGPYHEAIAERAIASCRAQTIPVEFAVVIDREGRGTGWARNQGLKQVQTDFVSFLDADDQLEPTFAAETLAAYDGRRYLYTDWLQEETVIQAPDCAWVDGTWHVVTTLVPTVWARYVGGFDEALGGGEDSDFYMKLCVSGLCGRRLAVPLMRYTPDGQRSQEFVGSAAFTTFTALMKKRYGSKRMSCCGENTVTDDQPVGEKQAGDVLALALWGGNRQERGRATGRLYPRTGNGKRVWADPLDIAAAPHHWAQVIEAPPPPAPPPNPAQLTEQEEFHALAEYAFGGKVQPATYTPRVNPLDDPPKPDVSRLRELYRYNAEMKLTKDEVSALRSGHALEVNDDGVKVNRRLAPDNYTRKSTDD